MMKKAHKYLMLFNAFLFLVILLMLPFVPFAKLGTGKTVYVNSQSFNQTNEGAVLATTKSAFSEVFEAHTLEATFSARQTDKTYARLFEVKNVSNKAKEFKIVAQLEDGRAENSTFVLTPYFENSSTDEISLTPFQSSSVSLSLERLGLKREANIVLIVLTSL
ncbi:MAG: hypothetical protein AAB443_01725 [Patescibacteria group bacterium]